MINKRNDQLRDRLGDPPRHIQDEERLQEDGFYKQETFWK